MTSMWTPVAVRSELCRRIAKLDYLGRQLKSIRAAVAEEKSVSISGPRRTAPESLRPTSSCECCTNAIHRPALHQNVQDESRDLWIKLPPNRFQPNLLQAEYVIQRYRC